MSQAGFVGAALTPRSPSIKQPTPTVSSLRASSSAVFGARALPRRVQRPSSTDAESKPISFEHANGPRAAFDAPEDIGIWALGLTIKFVESVTGTSLFGLRGRPSSERLAAPAAPKLQAPEAKAPVAAPPAPKPEAPKPALPKAEAPAPPKQEAKPAEDAKIADFRERLEASVKVNEDKVPDISPEYQFGKEAPKAVADVVSKAASIPKEEAEELVQRGMERAVEQIKHHKELGIQAEKAEQALAAEAAAAKAAAKAPEVRPPAPETTTPEAVGGMDVMKQANEIREVLEKSREESIEGDIAGIAETGPSAKATSSEVLKDVADALQSAVKKTFPDEDPKKVAEAVDRKLAEMEEGDKELKDLVSEAPKAPAPPAPKPAEPVKAAAPAPAPAPPAPKPAEPVKAEAPAAPKPAPPAPKPAEPVKAEAPAAPKPAPPAPKPAEPVKAKEAPKPASDLDAKINGFKEKLEANGNAPAPPKQAPKANGGDAVREAARAAGIVKKGGASLEQRFNEKEAAEDRKKAEKAKKKAKVNKTGKGF